MKLLNDWTKFEKILSLGSIIIIFLIGVLFKSNVLTVSCSIVGVITAFLHAKGKNLGQIFGLLITVLYSVVSFQNRYFGEVLIYVVIMLPMYIIGIISWAKHKNVETNSVEVNTIKKLEWIIILIATIGIYIGVYYLLKIFDTNELVISTISAVITILAIYFQVRRSKHSFSLFLIYDIIHILLWGIPVIKGNYILLPMFINPIINMISDIYGLYNWKRIEKIQNKANI